MTAVATALAVALTLALIAERWPSRSMLLAVPTWFMGLIAGELSLPLALASAAAIAVLAVLGALKDAAGMIALIVIALAVVRLVWLTQLQRRARQELEEALRPLEPYKAGSKTPAILRWIPPLMLFRRGVRHHRRLVYARRGRWRLKLDVYKPAASTPNEERRPAIIHIHGGGWIGGSRHEQGILLLNHLAANGWVGFNADYRLGPWARWPAQIVDVKTAIAWVREHAERFGIDPGFIAITGGSAGGHLAALAALTAGDPVFQPGFEEADTSVQAAVAFYGWYDMTDNESIHMPWVVSRILEGMIFRAKRTTDMTPFTQASPLYRVHEQAPPFFVLHGEGDSLIDVREARSFVRRLRELSRAEALYAELSAAQHAFDIVPSLRSGQAIEAVERFLSSVYARRATVPADTSLA
jgi:acetyl esterase/lipase